MDNFKVGDNVKVVFDGGYEYYGSITRVSKNGTDIGNGEINSSGKTIYIVRVTDIISFFCFESQMVAY